MKANRKFIEADARAVSAVIGVILMVAITVAIAATVYVYVSGMVGATQKQTPNIACITDSAQNKIIVASADINTRWNDVVISTTTGFTWAVYQSDGTPIGDAATWSSVPDSTVVIAGDYIQLTLTTGSNPCSATLKYTPTNSLIGTWTVHV